MIRPGVGLIVPYVSFYEQIAPMREQKRAFAQRVSERLSAAFEVLDCGLVTTEAEAREAGARLSRETVDAVIVAPAVATFGALPWTALEHGAHPVCLWNLQPDEEVTSGYDIGSVIRNSGSLGVQALANTLVRNGRVFEVAFSTERSPIPAKLIRFVQACAVYGSLLAARFGRIGTVFPQMTDVAFDCSKWTGRAIVDISPAELTATYEKQSAAAASSRVSEMEQRHVVEQITQDELSRSARLSLALDAIVEQHALDGGAWNCHGENCLQNSLIGVTACYAVSRQTSQGRPFSCTGDLPTAIAMKLLHDVAGSVLYAELDLVDLVNDFVLLANGGEGNFAFAAGETRIVGNENFGGLHGRGASLCFDPFEGPATILSLTPLANDANYRLIVAEGSLSRRSQTALKIFHAAFRFDGINAPQAYEQWCEAGAVHHLALAPGRWVSTLFPFARISGWELVVIGDFSR